MYPSGLHTVDYAVISGYFIMVFAVAAVIIWRDRKKIEDKGASDDYFLGGRNLGWFVIGASLFASNIGSEHLVGLAGSGASGDFPAAQFEILAAFMLLLLGWLFVPFYLKSGVYTMPEFLERRYNAWARGYLSWVSIIGYILTKISVTIAAGGIIFTALLGVDFWTGAIIVVIGTGVYTIFGGLRAVLYTDLIQLFILLGGSLAITYYGFKALGGWDELVSTVEPAYLSLWRSSNDSAFPWTGIIFGAPILGVWYWCTDQFIVQRVLAAKNIDQARRGSLFAGYLKLLPLFIFVLPGVMAFALTSMEQPALVFPEEDGKVIYDAALPVMTAQLLPIGVRGLVVAGLLAALMSSLSSVFNSCSTLFTFDIYQKYFPGRSEAKLVRVGQIATAVLVVLGLAWIPLLKQLEGGLFQKLQSIQSYISPPIAAVFLLGLFRKEINENGAKSALITGAIIGATRLFLEIAKISLPDYLSWFIEMNFLHFAVFLFAVSCGVLILSSLLSPSKKEVDLSLVWSKNQEHTAPGNFYLTMSMLLVVLIIILWYVFA